MAVCKFNFYFSFFFFIFLHHEFNLILGGFFCLVSTIFKMNIMNKTRCDSVFIFNCVHFVAPDSIKRIHKSQENSDVTIGCYNILCVGEQWKLIYKSHSEVTVLFLVSIRVSVPASLKACYALLRIRSVFFCKRRLKCIFQLAMEFVLLLLLQGQIFLQLLKMETKF